MPFDLARFKRLRKIKGIDQKPLAARAEVAQSQISDCERGIGPTVDLLEKLATALDCTTDFLLGRSFSEADANEAEFRTVVSRLAFDVFVGKSKTTDIQRERCNRILGDEAAPISCDEWVTLAKLIDKAVPPPTTDGGVTLKSIVGGKGN